MEPVITRETSVVILGGGPGGYEAALVAAQLGAEVTVVERDGLGGAAVLTDCVPSKALIATADYMTDFETASQLGVRCRTTTATRSPTLWPSRTPSTRRILALAAAQSADIQGSLEQVGVTVLRGTGPDRRPRARRRRARRRHDARRCPPTSSSSPPAPHPRVMDRRAPDGERILTWQQIYDLDELPERARRRRLRRHRRRARAGLPRSRLAGRPRVLPRPGAARRGRRRRHGHRGRLPQARHGGARHARGRPRSSAPPTASSSRSPTGAPSRARTRCSPSARCPTPRESGSRRPASRLTRLRAHRGRPGLAHHASAACTPPATAPACCPLASVAAMQGRIAMWHALGDAVAPLNLRGVAANVFTDPEIATVGISQNAVDECTVDAESVMLPLATQPARQDAGHHRRLRQALLPQGLRHGARRRRRRAQGVRADLPGDARGAEPAQRRPGGRAPSRSTRRCPARSPRPRASCTSPTDPAGLVRRRRPVALIALALGEAVLLGPALAAAAGHRVAELLLERVEDRARG